MAVVDQSLTPTTSASFIPTVWADGVVEAAEFAAILQKRVNRDWEKDLKIGNTLKVPNLSNLNTQARTPGGNPINTIVFEAITENVQTVTVSTWEYAAFLLEAITEVQANQDLRQRYTKKLGYAIARGREVNLAALFSTFTFNAAIGTLGVELTADDFLAGWSALAQAGLMEMSLDPGEDFSLVLSPAAYAAALKVDTFANRLYNTEGDAIQRAKVGDIYGFPVFMDSLLTSPAAGQHRCGMFHKEAIALIVQEEIPVQSQYMIRYLSDGVVGWNIYGYARVLFPPETPIAAGGPPETYTSIDNRFQQFQTV